jgi:hypothetical protein
MLKPTAYEDIESVSSGERSSTLYCNGFSQSLQQYQAKLWLNENRWRRISPSGSTLALPVTIYHRQPVRHKDFTFKGRGEHSPGKITAEILIYEVELSSLGFISNQVEISFRQYAFYGVSMGSGP